MTFAGILLVGVLLDAAFGWPKGFFDRIGHPVTWMGTLIATLDTRLNDDGATEDRRRITGMATVALVAVAAGLPAMAVQIALPGGFPGIVLGGVLAWPFIAIRSLHDHVAAVEQPLAAGDIAGARAAVAMIVGRDPAQLDAAGISRATIESLAENTSDGIVAPVFWGVIAGLPGLALYKAINTMDSMIGHRTPRHTAFGRAAARLDDLVNLAPARLSGIVIALVSARPRAALSRMWRDAGKHRSPNAGWPEAAMAGGLGIRLSGPRVYGARLSDEPWVNERAPDPDAVDIARGLALYRRAMLCLATCLAGLALA